MIIVEKKAFTLVELIVTITILIILGFIAFISFQGFSSDTRDSSRMSDIKNINKGLDLYFLENGNYPEPTNALDVTYSGSMVWQQGTFGESVYKKIERVSNVVLDPLTESEYVYSRLNDKVQIELGTILEGGDYFSYFLSPVCNTAHAQEQERVNAYVIGNYNGKVARVTVGGNIYILAVPTIISGDLSLLNLEDLINNKKLVYNGFKNLPSSYTGTTFEMNGDPDVDLINNQNFVIYSGSLNNLIENEQEQVQVLENIQNAYSGTDIIPKDNWLSRLNNLTIDIANPSDETKNMSCVLLKNLAKIRQIEGDCGGLVVSGGDLEGGEILGGDSVTIEFIETDGLVHTCGACN